MSSGSQLRRSPALFPERTEREHWDDLLTRELALAKERIAKGNVTPTLDLSSFRSELAGFNFLTPRPLEDLLSWTIAQLERGVVHVTHPRYFGLFNPAPTFPAQCADRIAAAFNPQLATSTTSPVAVEIEAHVIRSVARRAGSSEGGHRPLHYWRSRGELHGSICALTRSNPGFATKGRAPFEGPPSVLYLEGEPSCLAQNRAPGWYRPLCGASRGHRRIRPYGSECSKLTRSRPIAREAAFPLWSQLRRGRRTPG